MKAARSILFVYLATVACLSAVVNCCEDRDIYDGNQHFWCHKEQVGAWRKNRDCRWIGAPQSSIRTLWEKASGTSRCSQSEPCSLTFEVDYSRELRNYFGVEFNFGGEVDTKIGKLAANVNIKQEQTLTIRSARRQSFTCQVRPGYEAEVWIGTEIMTLRGRMNILEKQWDGIFFRPGSGRCWATDGTLEIPLKDKATGQASGPLECRQRPTADINDVYFVKNDKTLGSLCETDLVNEALDKMTRIVPPKDQEQMVTVSGCNGQTVYVQAKCFNMEDVHQYQARCSSCIRYTRENIMSKSQKSVGGNWRVNDCYLRYEFYHFTR